MVVCIVVHGLIKVYHAHNMYMARKNQDGLSIMRLQVLSSFLFHSELWEGPHLCAELDGNGFFLEFTSIGNFLVKKSEKNLRELSQPQERFAPNFKRNQDFDFF